MPLPPEALPDFAILGNAGEGAFGTWVAVAGLATLEATSKASRACDRRG